MVKRRKIGPAYEKSPIQRLQEWSTRNVLILFGAIVCCVVYWFIVNFAVDSLLNFLVTQGKEELEKPYSSDDPLWITIKLVGCIVILVLVTKSKAK